MSYGWFCSFLSFPLFRIWETSHPVAVLLPYCGRVQNFIMLLLHFVCVLYIWEGKEIIFKHSVCVCVFAHHSKHLCALDAFFIGYCGFEIWEKHLFQDNIKTRNLHLKQLKIKCFALDKNQNHKSFFVNNSSD